MTPTPEAVNEPLEGSLEEIAQRIQDVYFKQGAAVNIASWDITLALVRVAVQSSRRSLLTELQAYADKYELEDVRKVVEVFRNNK